MSHRTLSDIQGLIDDSLKLVLKAEGELGIGQLHELRSSLRLLEDKLATTAGKLSAHLWINQPTEEDGS